MKKIDAPEKIDSKNYFFLPKKLMLPHDFFSRKN